jgi:hypothetical protein
MSKRRNISDESQIKELTRDEKLRLEQEEKDLAVLLEQPEGRRYLWKMLDFCGVYRTSFTGSSETFYLEGKRNVGLMILSEIMKASPEAYLLMINENRKEESNV